MNTSLIFIFDAFVYVGVVLSKIHGGQRRKNQGKYLRKKKNYKIYFIN